MAQSQAALGPFDDDTAGVGGTGSITSKLRLMTAQLDQLSRGVPLSGGVALQDPITGKQATIAAFHNTDGQSFTGTQYALMTGGVAQLLNSAGNLDRARGAYQDNMPVSGIAFEAPGLWQGTGFDRARTPNVVKSIANVTVVAGTPVTGWAPAGGKSFRLMGYALSLSTSGTIVFKDNTTEFMRTPRAAVNTVHIAPPLGNGYLSLAANRPLTLDVSNSGVIDGYIYGTEE